MVSKAPFEARVFATAAANVLRGAVTVPRGRIVPVILRFDVTRSAGQCQYLYLLRYHYRWTRQQRLYLMTAFLYPAARLPLKPWVGSLGANTLGRVGSYSGTWIRGPMHRRPGSPDDTLSQIRP